MRAVLDIECYHNYFLALFIFEDGSVIKFERFNDKDNMNLVSLARSLQEHTIITFNGKRYDMPMLSLAINGANNETLKEASDHIIVDDWWWWTVEQHYGFMTLDVDHIDIINILPGMISLKLYGARIHTKKVQDLPYPPESIIDDEKARDLREYCRNDCQLTWELFVERWPVIKLRMDLGKMYNQDLRSRSDAQIAEAVMKSEFQNITGTPLMKPIDSGQMPTEITYTAPEWVQFDGRPLDELVQDLMESHFKLNKGNGKPDSPDWLKRKTMRIDGKPYTVGLGGLHAKNKAESYFSRPGGRLVDLDVTSYYPSIILSNGYEPTHMGSTFTQIYSALVKQRLEAKASGDAVNAELLKITINGTFGKLGSRYSAIYAPELMLGVTLSGQLALLMLIEMMALRGIQTVSANTDGVTLIVEDDAYKTVWAEWQNITGLNLEALEYESIHYRDCNNYFAKTTDGKVKRKGIFKPTDIAKNPEAGIVFDAVINYVMDNKPIRNTLAECVDVEPFLTARKVAGGGAKDGEYLGKAVRWYYSTETDTAIHYISNGNMVAKSQGGMPMMELMDHLPPDLDWEWYVREAEATLKLIGYYSWL